MKKIFLLLIACTFTCISFAQSSLDNRYVYCELIGVNKLLSNKMIVSVDMGQQVKLFSTKNQYLVDENNNPISFNSMIDAMNFMGKNGWEFLQSYMITSSQTLEHHWILKRDISLFTEEQQEAMMGEINLNK